MFSCGTLEVHLGEETVHLLWVTSKNSNTYSISDNILSMFVASTEDLMNEYKRTTLKQHPKMKWNYFRLSDLFYVPFII